MNDVFYDYSKFEEERLKGIFFSWDEWRGYHAALLKFIANLIEPDTSVLEVGCGLCHLFELLESKGCVYSGFDNEPRILAWAQNRYPSLDIRYGNLYDMGEWGTYDYVILVGVYRHQPSNPKGIQEVIKHARKMVILTYFANTRGILPEILNIDGWATEIIPHNIDNRLEIVKIMRK